MKSDEKSVPEMVDPLHSTFYFSKDGLLRSTRINKSNNVADTPFQDVPMEVMTSHSSIESLSLSRENNTDSGMVSSTSSVSTLEPPLLLISSRLNQRASLALIKSRLSRKEHNRHKKTNDRTTYEIDDNASRHTAHIEEINRKVNKAEDEDDKEHDESSITIDSTSSLFLLHAEG
jgi:hypothetical protein